WLLLSTPLDVRTEDPIGHLISLIRTEFEIEDCQVSHHRLYHSLQRFLLKTHFTRAFFQNIRILHICERISRLLYKERGITHIILLVRKKSLF
nr:hypothetical protein [Chlamydiota bacterium]